MHRWLALALLTASLGGSAPPSEAQLAEAAPAPHGLIAYHDRSGEMSLRSRVALEPADVKELLLGPAARAGGAGSADRPIGTGEAWSHLLVRELPVLWELLVAGDTRPGDLDVRYEIHSPDGRRNRLRHASDHASTMAVRLISRPPSLVHLDRGRALVQGGLTLELQLDSVRSAGSYRGTLTVTVNQL